MKKQELSRRLLSLTLAASVALPQPTVFATSLWTEQAGERLDQILQDTRKEQDEDQTKERFDDMDSQQDAITSSVSDQKGTSVMPGTDADHLSSEPGADPSASVTDGSQPGADPDTPVVDSGKPETGSDRLDDLPGEKESSPPTTQTDTTLETKPDEGAEVPSVSSDVTTDDDSQKGEGEKTDQTDGKDGQTPPEETETAEPETALPQEIQDVTANVDDGGELSSALDADRLSADAAVQTGRDAFWPLSLYRIGYGVPFEGWANGKKAALTEMDGLFAVETTEGQRFGAAYGARLYDDVRGDPAAVPLVIGGDGSDLNDYHSFAVFPSAEMLGRVPDRQFAGWYVYASGDKAGDKTPEDWVYGDEDVNHAEGYSMPQVVTKPYGETDPGYDASTAVNGYSTVGELGDTWDGGADYGYGHLFQYDENGRISVDEDGNLLYGEGAANPVSIVGRWEASDTAKARDGQTSLTAVVDGKEIPLPLYGADISTKPLSECTETTFSADRTQYWLRVPANVTELDLAFHTEELYYADYVRDEGRPEYDHDAYRLSAEKSHIQVNATFGGETTQYVTSDRISGGETAAVMAPKWERKDAIIHPQNTREDPAHSEWTVKGITLTPAAGAGKLYTDIEVVITSPSGKVTTTYTFHVQRLTEPALTRSWGNTPMGMIQRDVSAVWGETQAEIAANKQLAKDYFYHEETDDSGNITVVANRKFSEEWYPRGSANQNGTVYRGVYAGEAWLAKKDNEEDPDSTVIANDVDMDPTAIVVYQDSTFLDPGISLTDSEGLPVDITAGKVERSLKLESAPTLSAEDIGRSGSEGWYHAGSLVGSETYEVLLSPDGSDQIDLRGLNVLPGVYTLEYRFTDKVADGKTYGAEAGSYVTEAGKAGAADFVRTVVVLPTPGDVDMDGAVTMADALALERLLEENEHSHMVTLNGAPITENQMAALFAYRVCDINGDGLLDDQDVAALRLLPNPKTVNEHNASNSDYFYIPLPTGEDSARYTRPELTEAATDVARLTLEYLGKEGGKFQKGGYALADTITGPWNAIPAVSPDGTSNGVELGDVFWLAVSLENTEELSLPGVKSFTFTLIYDALYLRPAVVLNQADWDMLGAEYDPSTEAGAAQQKLNRWRGMMRMYNLAGSASTVWSQGSYRFTEVTGYGDSFTTHYSTAVIPLETAVGQSSVQSRLKELTFSVELQSGDGVILQEGGEKSWILAVPFELIKHPFNQKSAQLVEFEAGMRGFTLVGSDNTAAAYSGQDGIFGGETINLKEKLGYGDLGAQIPLGEDRTEIYWVANGSDEKAPNAKYDVLFSSNGGWSRPEEGQGSYQQFPLNGELIGELPPGLVYHRNSGYIDGRPSQAGTYDFSIGSVPYRIVVDKTVLRFWADNQRSYYGQSQFRGESSNDFTYRYNIDDIRSFERTRAAADSSVMLDGNGAHLAALLSDPVFNLPENQPYFKAGTDEATAVTAAADVGTYPIWCRNVPMSTNYEFQYTPASAGGSQGLTILQRPIQVVGIQGTMDTPVVVGTVFSDRPGELSGLRAQLNGSDPAMHTFQVQLGTTVTDRPGEYDGLPLTAGVDYIDGAVMPGDCLQVTYSAQYIRTEADMGAGESGFFVLAEGENEGFRDVSVGTFRLVGGTGWENYRLVSAAATESVRSGRVQGKVLRRNIKTIEITQLPPMAYQYGDQLESAAALHYYIVKDGDQEEGQYAYSAESVQSLGITVTWVTAAERDAYLNGKTYDKNDALPYGQSQRFTTEYDGRYICLTVSTADDKGEPIVIRVFSDTPLTVKKRLLTLTATPDSRFYGEENAGLSFTYDPAQLANADRQAGLTGDGAELVWLLSDENSGDRGWTQHYVAPTLRAVFLAKDPAELTSSDDLKKSSPYTGMNNAVMIYGASSDNYAFEYVFTDTEGNTSRREDYGASTYRIEKRLIVVEAVTKTDAPMSRLYADTRRIYTEGLPLTMDEVRLGLPEHTDTTTSYFSTGGGAGQADMGYAPGATAVVGEDEIAFSYTATVAPTDGADYVKYTDFSKGYFNMDTDDAGHNLAKGYKEYPVQVSSLQLTGKDANNYVLVYKSEHCGVLGLPNEYQQVTLCVDPEVNATKTYYAAKVDGAVAMAQVWLRPIKDIEVLSTGKLKYTYGESYTPNQWDADSRDRRGMVIRIHYENDPAINNYAGNSTEEDVSYLIHHYLSDGTAVTTYDNRGLGIYYLTQEVYEKYLQTGEVMISAANRANEMRLQTPLYVVSEHNGAHLVVLGERSSQTAPVVSKPTEEVLQVAPKELTLRADDKRRSYGEENGDFTFSFDAAQLAVRDRTALGVSADMQDGGLLAQLARQTGFRYTEPTFTSAAGKKSNVRNGGREGYPISVASAGALENYTLRYETGTLYIYPRRVKIGSFDKTSPIYTIFSDDSTRRVSTNVSSDRFALIHSTEGGYVLDGEILRTTGDALVEGDSMVLTITVQYPDNLDLDSSEAKGDIAVEVVNASIMADSAGTVGNYQLETMGGSTSDERAVIVDGSAIGTVELRNIEDIRIISQPNKMHYTYGRDGMLDLSGLSIRIEYNTGSGGGTDRDTNVDYMGPEQFAQYGLHVYYYDSATWNPEDDEDDIGTEIILRAAATGDHLTIAPTHDTQTKSRDKLFSANGKYLLVTAQRHSDQKIVVMIVQTPITVDPLPIEFTLSAQDKIYNGNTQAAGTITFTNIFDQSGFVDDYNQNGITDLVYPVTGADYEVPWTSPTGSKRQEAFNRFGAYVAENGYSFTTGEYVPNDPDRPTENAQLAWEKGYTYGAAGTMTFSYLDPNVAYVSEPGYDQYGALARKKVQVTGLRLAGPDAANYTLVGQSFERSDAPSVSVTADNAATIREYLDGELPTAVIHKANRANLTAELLPQVEIDPHTNAVRVSYDQSLSAIAGGEEGAYLEELHFEFGLQKIVIEQEASGPVEGDDGEDPEEDTPPALTVTDILSWAGPDGSDIWADPRYFGGEAGPLSPLEVETEDPEAPSYVPKEEDIPKADSVTENTTIKGQFYQWSEEDAGFRLDPSAYPGGVIWPGYDLYTIDRVPLERDAIYLPVVRAAETHNYNPSLGLSSVEGYTPEMVQALLDAREAWKMATDQADREQARQALDAAIQTAGEAIAAAVQGALDDAQAEVDALMSAGESSSRLTERPARSAAPAVKTYRQSIETVSVKELQGEGAASDAEPYLVPTLEAVWFTDVRELPSKEVLDAVVWNTDPTRYRIYAWDSGLNATLEFNKEEPPISLDAPFEVEIPGDTDGEGTGETIRVNEEYKLRLYADITFPRTDQNKKVERIVLRPGTLLATLGDAPAELEITFYPEQHRKPAVLWVSSAPEVATVDSHGRITFVGVGTAYIIATVLSNIPGAPALCSTYIEVTVVEDWKTEYPDSIFDFGHLDAFLTPKEDGDKLFLPEARITRGEAAMLLAQFYVENSSWSRTGPQEFTDLTGEEEYADAARLLGSLGVMIGYPDGSFGGEQYISRAEFITLLARMTGVETPNTAGQPHAFLDTGETDTWAYAEIDAMSAQPGVLLGVGEGYFAPNRSIIRSEAAAFLTRLLRFPLNQAGELLVPLDVTEEYWARDSILRAVNGSQIMEESFTEDA